MEHSLLRMVSFNSLFKIYHRPDNLWAGNCLRRMRCRMDPSLRFHFFASCSTVIESSCVSIKRSSFFPLCGSEEVFWDFLFPVVCIINIVKFFFSLFI